RSWGGRPAWRLDRLDAHPSDRIDLLAAALDALAGLPEPLDFVHGWALVHLAPLLAASGMIPEALVAALGSLSDRFDGRAGAVDALLPPGDPRLQLLTDPDPLPGLLAAVRAIGDPYLRFRGYRRLLLVFPGRCGELLERRGAERGEA